MRVRAAEADDAPAIGRVHVETWRAAYRGLVSDAYLAALSPAERAEQWRRFLYSGELYAIYVLPSHHRRGIGRALVRAVADRLTAAGRGSMLLWILDANAGARTFYEALGGVRVREQTIEIGGVVFSEVAYGWASLDPILVAG